MNPYLFFLSLSNNRIKVCATVPDLSVWTSQHSTCFLSCVSKDLLLFICLFSEDTLKSLCSCPRFGLGVLFVCSFDTGSLCVTQDDPEFIALLPGMSAVPPCPTKRYFYFPLICYLYVEMQLIFVCCLCILKSSISHCKSVFSYLGL